MGASKSPLTSAIMAEARKQLEACRPVLEDPAGSPPEGSDRRIRRYGVRLQRAEGSIGTVTITPVMGEEELHKKLLHII